MRGTGCLARHCPLRNDMRSRLPIAVFLFLLAFAPGKAGGSILYDVIDLGSLGGSTAGAAAVNASGQIVGLSDTTGDAAYHATLWTNSSSAAIDLGTLGGTESQAIGINDLGQIVGLANITGDAASHAALWTNSSSAAIDLGTLGGTYSGAIGINASGQVVGWANTSDSYAHAALWTNSSSAAIDLGTLGGAYGQAIGINDLGQIIGVANITGDAASHAALWTNSSSAAIDLGTLGGAYSRAIGINASGQVVGWAYTSDSSTHAALWTNGASLPIDLNGVIATNTGWVLIGAYGINDAGEIVGYGIFGVDRHAFALIPIPQNTSTNTWISVLDGKWETSTNWSNGSAPSLADSAETITNENTKTVAIDSVTANTPGVMTISNLFVSAPLGSTNTLFLDNVGAASPLQILNGLAIGSGGVLVVSGSSLVAGSVSNAGMIQATAGTLEFFGLNIGTNDTLSGAIAITNGAALLLSGTDTWTIGSGIAYGGGTSGGSIISSNSGAIQSVFLSDPAFCNNGGTLAVVGGNVINYGQIGADLTNNYVITGSGSFTGSFGPNNYAMLNQGTIASVSGGTLVLDSSDAFDFGGVQNTINGTIVAASDSTLSIRRTEDAWDNPAASYPTNFGAVFMQGGILSADDDTTASTNRVYVNDFSGVIEGCGTFSNWTTVLNNGFILANCRATLTFSGVVTNNGTMQAANGNVLEAYGTVVNNGTIDIINGGITNFQGGFVNNGTVLTAGSVAISNILVTNIDVEIQIQSVPGHTYQLQISQSLTPNNWVNSGTQSGNGSVLTFTDAGGATNVPTRFYQILCTSP